MFLNLQQSFKRSRKSFLNAHLHYGKKRSKIEGLKEQNTIFCIKKKTYHDFSNNVTRNGG